MSSSWEHALVQLSVQELYRLAQRAQADQERWPDWPATTGRCALGRVTHTDLATYRYTYQYVTGRAGRVSWAERLICGDHAVKVAAKHEIDLARVPVEPARQKHASEEAFEAPCG